MSNETDRKKMPGFADEQAEFQRQQRSDAPKGKAGEKVLRARPVKGEIDFSELIREHLARFPKIRARLAK